MTEARRAHVWTIRALFVLPTCGEHLSIANTPNRCLLMVDVARRPLMRGVVKLVAPFGSTR